MSRSVLGYLWSALAAALLAAGLSPLHACTDGTTPECSGDANACGYPPPTDVDAGSRGDGSGG